MQSHRGNFLSGPQPEDTVTILRTDYENLVSTAQNHAELCRRLLNTSIEDVGVVQALKTCLSSLPIQYPDTIPNQHMYNANAPSFVPASHDFDTSSVASTTSSYLIGQAARHGIYPFPPPRSLIGSRRKSDLDSTLTYDDSFEDSCVGANEDDDDDDDDANHVLLDHSFSSLNIFQEPPFRSVQLLNIPEDATYADIIAVVRGGNLFDISLIRRSSTAFITFAEASAAEAYYTHVRNNYLYIKNNKIDIRRSGRFQNLHGHFAKRIANGATRNLVLRSCNAGHTNASIRNDLDHIHGLEVISITFRGGMCHISTNSLPSAMYARTCMMSRLKYKSSLLEWDADECAQPLNQVPVTPRRRAPFPTAPARQSISSGNRFQLLADEE
ncbi:hypothetical protein V8C35DRAFT_332051 [Trichoderma chlorosporum]